MSNQKTICDLRMKHILSKPELKDAIKKMRNVVRVSDGEKALFCLTHLIDGIESYSDVIDTLFAEIDSQKVSLESALEQIRRLTT